MASQGEGDGDHVVDRVGDERCAESAFVVRTAKSDSGDEVTWYVVKFNQQSFGVPKRFKVEVDQGEDDDARQISGDLAKTGAEGEKAHSIGEFLANGSDDAEDEEA